MSYQSSFIDGLLTYIMLLKDNQEMLQSYANFGEEKKDDKDLDNTITVHKLSGDSVKHFSRGTRYKNEQIF